MVDLDSSDVKEVRSSLFTGLNRSWDYWEIQGSELSDHRAQVEAEGRIGTLTAYVDDNRKWGFEYEHNVEVNRDEGIYPGEIEKVEGLLEASTNRPEYSNWDYEGGEMTAEFISARELMNELFKVDRLDDDLMRMGLGREEPL